MSSRYISIKRRRKIQKQWIVWPKQMMSHRKGNIRISLAYRLMDKISQVSQSYGPSTSSQYFVISVISNWVRKLLLNSYKLPLITQEIEASFMERLCREVIWKQIQNAKTQLDSANFTGKKLSSVGDCTQNWPCEN